MCVTEERGGGGGSTNTLNTKECPGIGCGQQDAQLATLIEKQKPIELGLGQGARQTSFNQHTENFKTLFTFLMVESVSS